MTRKHEDRLIESRVKSRVESRIESMIWSRIKSMIESKIESMIESRIESMIRSRIKSRIESRIESRIKSRIESRIENLIENLIESRPEIEFKSTRQVDQIESKIWLNSFELSWSLSTQLKLKTWSELSWATWTWWQIYAHQTSAYFENEKNIKLYNWMNSQLSERQRVIADFWWTN